MLLILVLASSTAFAETTYIKAGNVFDGQHWRGAGAILVCDGRIAAVEESTYAIPAGADVIDASDCTVMPGFIHTYVQLVAPPKTVVEDIEHYGAGRLTVEAMSGYPCNRLDLLKRGVTTIADIGSPFGIELGLKRALERGSIIGPRLIAGGPFFTAPGGIPVSTTFAGHHDWIDFATYQAWDTLKARRRVSELARQGVNFVTVVYDSTGGVPRLRLDMVEAVIDQARRDSLRACVLVHGYVNVAEAAGMRETLPDRIDDGAAGGLFAKMRARELSGFSRLHVLNEATIGASYKVGRESDLGRVAPGYQADLVFYTGRVDSGELNASRIERVMLGGKTVVEHGRVPNELAYGFRRKVLDGIAYPYWDPLLSFLFGGSITDYDLLGTGTTASADLLYSTRNMWLVNVSFLPPSPIPRTALRVAAHFDNQNRLFYGLGNDARLDSAVEYRNVIFRELVGAQTRIGGSWKAIGSLSLDQTRVRPYGTDTLPDGLVGRDGGHELMLSLALAHDTRDHQINPWYGHYIGAGVMAAPAVLPTGHAFGRAFAEARGYVSVAHHHVLVGRVLYQQAFGAVPFYYLPEQGGDTLGRGFLPYRFRDRVALIGQLEYRFPVWSFISGAAFVDLGQFCNGPDDFTLAGFHPSIGFGPRFSLGPNESSIVGIDIGFTPEGWNLCLHNGQVF